MGDGVTAGPRCAALVGSYLSGKTTLLEALLFAAGAVTRKGTAKEGNTVGDGSPAARSRQMSVELNVATCGYLGDEWCLVDCPGSIEFGQDGLNALMVADVAVVVCEPDTAKAAGLAPLFRFLDDHGVPHMVFINKMDHASSSVLEVLEALQAVSERPLVLRQVPIMNGEVISGYVDLVSERAYEYRPGEPSALIEIPDTIKDEEAQARQELLESLADFDDRLLEQLLEDVVPEKGEVYQHLSQNIAEDRVVPVLLGSAETHSGVLRLWKSLRHDTPPAGKTAERRGFTTDGEPVVQAFKTVHAAHAGKLNIARVWSGEIHEGAGLGGSRIGGLFTLFGQQHNKVSSAGAGQVVALGRMEGIQTGDVLTPEGRGEGGDAWAPPISPVYAMAVTASRREDEVKLSGALQRLVEEDPSYRIEQNQDTRELVLCGQGEIHLGVALEHLRERYKIEATGARPQVPYKETIRKSIEQHARHKKQTGGHGQFGDVKVEIKPLPRGQGFEFTNRVVGGVVPRQFIPSVEHGVREYLQRGPLGFPVVDITVCLFDGQHHSVDSSDQAFRAAAQLAMREGMPKCGPVLLEPICKVEIDVPNEYTAKVNTLITGRRGQILGFEAKEGWSGWDTVQAYMPHAEMHDLIVELRSLSQGAGTYRFDYDHLAELTGREAEQIIAARQEADAA
ncbi:MAG: elongation factor G [Alphaproteobacteria bacterium]